MRDVGPDQGGGGQVRGVRRSAASVAIALACGVAPVATGIAWVTPASATVAPLPSTGSTLPADDLTSPTFDGVAISDAMSWLQAGLSARAGEVSTLASEITTAAGLPSTVRSTLTNVVASTSQTLTTVMASSATDADIRQVRHDAATMIVLHVFSVLTPQVNEIVTAQSIRNSAVQLLAQEVSIRAALVAAKTTKVSLSSATSQLTAFHAHLVHAKALVEPLPAALIGVGTIWITRATAKLASAANTESAATALIVSAKNAEQSIISSLTSKLRAKSASV